MKRFLSVLSILLVIAMLPCASFAVTENTLPIANGDVTLSVYIGMNANCAQFYTSYAEHPVVIQMMKETGLNLEFIHPTGDTATFFNTTVASGDYPDIWRTSFASYPGGAEAAMEDGILLNVDTLIAEYAPNLSALADKLDTWKYMKADSGVIVNMGSTMQCDFTNNKAFRGMVIRRDLLEKLNLDIPETYEEWDNVLSTLQANGFETPMALPFAHGGFQNQNTLSAGFGVAHKGWFIQDGEVVYSPVQEGYREYLLFLRDWYNKGYFNADSFNYNEGDAGNELTAGKVAVVHNHAANTSTLNAAGVTLDPDFYASGAHAPRSEKGEVLTVINKNAPMGTGNPFFISATSEHPVEAMRFIDYLYMDSTQQLTAWGTTGDLGIETTQVVDGKKTWSEFITKNPDGLDMTAARDRYSLNSFQIMWEQSMEEATYGTPEKTMALDCFNTNTERTDLYPEVATMTVDEANTYANIMSQIDTYASEMMQKFIVGEASIEEDWDAYVQQIEALNLESAKAIKVESYNRYMSR